MTELAETIMDSLAELTRERPMFMHFDSIGLLYLDKTNQDRLECFDAILNGVAGKGGNLIIPAYSYSFCRQEVFNVDGSPTTLGDPHEFLRARNFEYVKAARALGVSNGKIMIKHVLPNATVAALTMVPFLLVGSITLLTSLDFIGFGLSEEYPSLGRLMQQGKNNLQAPWLGLTAFFTLSIMLTLLIFIGEAVRDALDPRKALA